MEIKNNPLRQTNLAKHQLDIILKTLVFYSTVCNCCPLKAVMLACLPSNLMLFKQTSLN